MFKWASSKDTRRSYCKIAKATNVCVLRAVDCEKREEALLDMASEYRKLRGEHRLGFARVISLLKCLSFHCPCTSHNSF